MNTVSSLDVWLNNLFGMKSFEGRCAFLYDGRIELSIEAFEDDRSLFLYAPVTTVPAEGKEAFYEKLLSLSQPGGELHGACLSLDENKQSVILWYARPLECLDIEGFQNMVGSFLDMADRLWRNFDIGQEANSPSDPRFEGNVTTDYRGLDVFRP